MLSQLKVRNKQVKRSYLAQDPGANQPTFERDGTLDRPAFRRAQQILKDSKKKTEHDARPSLFQLVAPTGFEPAISALRGRRPKPLDDGAMLAGVEGVEPSHTVPETAVLPLDDTPMCAVLQELDANRYIIGIGSVRQERTRTFSKGGNFTPLAHLFSIVKDEANPFQRKPISSSSVCSSCPSCTCSHRRDDDGGDDAHGHARVRRNSNPHHGLLRYQRTDSHADKDRSLRKD